MRIRRFSPEQEEEAAINITPLLDIVFIMLIFFIVTTSFVRESGVSVNRPTAATAKHKPKAIIMVGIKPNGEIWMEKRMTDIRAVRANVERLHAENPVASALIVADEDVKTGLLVDVMDQIRLAGIKNVSIAAKVD
ncbi:MAG: biopolymer transporter ExbD [Deltaproteobacteria bacterium]|jgi:biopolymer transport protein ExbD|nr:biopolymer transporter ExbD [Deltaproteobacteria bacterium]MDL1986862.1 biopolymer transporter ExbD [Deltaproteobacteria bacterium]